MIVVKVQGGVVFEVTGIPPGVEVEVHDYDIPEADEDDGTFGVDADGETYAVTLSEAGSASTPPPTASGSKPPMNSQDTRTISTHAINGAPICPHCRVIGSHDGGCPRAGCTCGHIRRFHRGPDGDGYQCDSCYNDSRGPGYAHSFDAAPVVSHQPGCSCDGSLDFREADWTIAREAEVSFLNLGRHTSFCRYNAVTACTCYVADYIASLKQEGERTAQERIKQLEAAVAYAMEHVDEDHYYALGNMAAREEG